MARPRRTKKQRKGKKKGKIALLTKKVNRLYKGLETKESYQNTYISTQSSYATGSVVPLWYVAQGDSNLSRTGNYILCKSLHVNGRILANASATAPTQSQHVRIIIFRDKRQVSDSTPSTSDILGASSPYTFALTSFVRVPSRFEILYDRFMCVFSTPTTYSIQHDNQKYFRIRKNLKNLKMGFNGSATTDIESNGLYMLVLSDENQAVGAYWQIEARITFSDA